MAAQRVTAVALLATLVLAACGSSAPRPASTAAPGTQTIPPALEREARPIGRGPRFHPPATGPVLGDCRHGLGSRQGVHMEVFGANRVVLLAAGVGARPPYTYDAGRISGAACFGELVTVDPTGVVLIRPGARLTLADLFRSWGQPLTADRVASFSGRVRLYVDGRRRSGDPRHLTLESHQEIVLEVGPYVPPHASYRFPPGT